MPDPDAASALRIEGLSKRYGGGKLALADVDLEVGRGELVGLLGPNGAGKSTLTKIACGLVGPSAGSASVLGVAAGSIEARRSLGYLAELFRFPSWLSGEEVLSLHQRLCGSDGGLIERGELLERVDLAGARGVRVGEMSKGMQQRLGIAQALIGSPRLLLLDEPTSALDPAGRRIVRELLVDCRARGISALLNSHLLGEVERICDSVMIINHGRVVAEGAPGTLGSGDGLEIETGSGLRSFERVERGAIPSIVRSLVEAGESVFAVRATGSSLEDAYLDAVADSDSVEAPDAGGSPQAGGRR